MGKSNLRIKIWTIDRITTGAVLDGAIQTSDIATGAVDNDRLAVNAVTVEKMAPNLRLLLVWLCHMLE